MLIKADPQDGLCGPGIFYQVVDGFFQHEVDMLSVLHGQLEAPDIVFDDYLIVDAPGFKEGGCEPLYTDHEVLHLVVAGVDAPYDVVHLIHEGEGIILYLAGHALPVGLMGRMHDHIAHDADGAKGRPNVIVEVGRDLCSDPLDLENLIQTVAIQQVYEGGGADDAKYNEPSLQPEGRVDMKAQRCRCYTPYSIVVTGHDEQSVRPG